MMKIWIEEDTNTLHSMSVLGGCHGYLQSILRLLKGKKIEECISALQGIQCGRRGTSCPDQLARALMEYQKGKK